jgi:hypothetical protein
MIRSRTSPHLRLIAIIVLAVAALAPDAPTQGSPCNLGSWKPAYDYTGPGVNPPLCANPPVGFPTGPFDAIHSSLIPKGPHRGHVMMFNHIVYTGTGVGQTRVITYTIVDTQTQQFWDHVVCLAPDLGDLFCAGHTWNANGDLVLAGGTTMHRIDVVQPYFGGAKLLYVWQPPTTLGAPGTWVQGPPLDDFRWYPSLVAMGPHPATDLDDILVMGGSHPIASQFINSYQCWQPAGGPAGSWEQNGVTFTNTFAGPPPTADLRDYPRAHFLSNKEVGTAGMSPHSMKVLQYTTPPTPPGTWQGPAPMGNVSLGLDRLYGSSVLFPISPGGGIKDVVVAIGGNTGGTILSSFEWSLASASNPSWVQAGNLNQARWFLNTVLLPDSTILALGGEQQFLGFGCSQVPALVPEILVAGQWQGKLGGTIIRDYHSTSLLLPTAEVLSTGGESRHYGPWPNCTNKTGRVPTVFPADFQVFVPPYINCGKTRPVINVATGATLGWGYGTQQSVGYVSLPFGISVAKVVLVRPGSATHHCDPNQRCVELAFSLLPDTDPPTGNSALQIAVPSKMSYLLPRGYYMLFFVTNQGTPSNAAWVQIS